jgi:hypothetical protein
MLRDDLANELDYTPQNYVWAAVSLGNGMTLAQGTIFEFQLYNGTNFGEQANVKNRLGEHSSWEISHRSYALSSPRKETWSQTSLLPGG